MTLGERTRGPMSSQGRPARCSPGPIAAPSRDQGPSSRSCVTIAGSCASWRTIAPLNVALPAAGPIQSAGSRENSADRTAGHPSLRARDGHELAPVCLDCRHQCHRGGRDRLAHRLARPVRRQQLGREGGIFRGCGVQGRHRVPHSAQCGGAGCRACPALGRDAYERGSVRDERTRIRKRDRAALGSKSDTRRHRRDRHAGAR